jgi:cardiolipin synthase
MRHRADDDRLVLPELRQLADQAFSRAAGAQLVGGNRVLLLKDAEENYPAWLEAIRSATRHVHFECYIIHEDEVGCRFARALMDKAAEGVKVRVIYDWLGGLGKASRRFWKTLRAAGVELRCYNPPQFDSPLGWLSRDHRKMLAVDGEVGFVTGLCVGRMWVGDPVRQLDPWRDTGVEIRGPAVQDIEHAFARIWAEMGDGIPEGDSSPRRVDGNVSVRIVASEPATAGMIRLDQLVAALARQRLWLTDAYYAGSTTYVQALRAAAMDGVDVRLLLPNGTDIPLLRPLSRAGYRLLLESGVRVFEWNGTMLHAKTAVADGRWARVGSTNLNVASWFGNWELDAVIQDEPFAAEMEQLYLEDLTNATEIVLDEKHKIRALGAPRHRHPVATSGGGSGGRAAAGALRIGKAVGAAIADRRVLGPVEARVAGVVGLLLCLASIVFLLFPRVLQYPVAVLCAWGGLSLLLRAVRLHRRKRALE